MTNSNIRNIFQIILPRIELGTSCFLIINWEEMMPLETDHINFLVYYYYGITYIPKINDKEFG